MELFYCEDIDSGKISLSREESQHCVRVLRHKEGDAINVIDGKGTLYGCILEKADDKCAVAGIKEISEEWGGHDYHLCLAVCPTKNNDRYEWFLEKACEIGADEIIPVIGQHSERKVYKTERAEKILISAAKQSLKAAVPVICEPVTVKEFIESKRNSDALKMIAYCFEDENIPRISIKEALLKEEKEFVIMIGPEGDFSKEEASLALECGFVPVHLGPSRLRTETAAVTAAEAVYFRFL